MSTAPPTGLIATDIDGVLASLDRIVAWAKVAGSRQGYFPALYRKVTQRIKDGFLANEFEDNPRLERFDVIFANRYLEAFEAYHAGRATTSVWRIAFDATEKWHLTVVQHLLLGINAHIDLDLGIAAAETVDFQDLPALKNDFDAINGLLIAMVDQVQDELGEVWPLLRWLDLAAGGLDEWLARFGIEQSRGAAWRLAQEYTAAAPEARPAKLADMDRRIAHLSRLIESPGIWLRLSLLLVRLGELRSVPRIIEILR